MPINIEVESFRMTNDTFKILNRKTISMRRIISGFTVLLAILIFQLPVAAKDQTRPLIFVPGIAGSTLAAKGNMIWGSRHSLNRSNFVKLDLLPKNGRPEPLVANDVLRKVPLLFGGLVSVGIYSSLIEFLEQKLGYKEGESLFVFPYDWRRTNFSTAYRLAKYIESKVGDRKYDLIAHSMGGIVTRLMLAGGSSGGVCEGSQSKSLLLKDIGSNELNTLCNTIYGPSPSELKAIGSWPSKYYVGPYDVAENLNTYIEIAVPHKGSNNIVGTYMEGWGGLSRLLAGGRVTIQSVLLSMGSPIELAPVYENCCAVGRAGHSGNRPLRTLDQKLMFDWWGHKILGFGIKPCPYHRCQDRKRILAASLEARRSISNIVDSQIPSNVKRLAVFFGMDVKNTKLVHYVARKSLGNGKGITFRESRQGDGTVPRPSAVAPESFPRHDVQQVVAARLSHPFIFESDALRDQIKYAILNPVQGRVIKVAGEVDRVGGSVVNSSAAHINPSIALSRESLNIQVSITTGDPIDAVKLAAESFSARLRSASSAEILRTVELKIDQGATLESNGELALVATFNAPDKADIYVVEIMHVLRDGNADPLEKTLLSVISSE